MRSGSAAAEYRRSIGFHGENLDRGIFFFQIFTDSGQSSSGSDSGDECVDFTVGVAPDFRSGRPFVACRIGRIFKLLGNEGAGMLSMEFLCFVDRAFHPGRPVGQHDLRPVCLKQFPAFDAHGVRHGEDQTVSFDCGGESETDPSISGGRLNNKRSRLEESAFFRIFDHGEADAVFDA